MTQVVILAGGTGTRLREQTELTPKPLVPIGGKPLIWHIIHHYEKYGFYDFILALGYKQEAFKEYFNNYSIINNDVEIHTVRQSMTNIIKSYEVDLSITLSDTGLNTLKGGRLNRVKKYIEDETFMMTYGDAVSDVNLDELLKFHKKHKKMVTITGVHPEPRFGELFHTKGKVISYKEKEDNGCLVNGGFMVLNREIFDYLDDDCDFEKGPLEEVAKKGQLMVYHHKGFWKPVDTLNDMLTLQKIWDEGGWNGSLHGTSAKGKKRG